MRIPFWPFRALVFATSLPPDAAMDALDDALRGDWAKRREGAVLRFTPDPAWLANAWRPRARASATSAPYGADVRVSLRISHLVLAFTALWLLGATAGAISGTAWCLEHGSPAGLVAWIMPVFGLGVVAACFEPEARLVERTCRRALPSPPDPTPGPTGPFR